MEQEILDKSKPIKIRTKSILLERLENLQIEEYVDIDVDNDPRGIGNLISAKIAIWKSKNVLQGIFSRKHIKEEGVIRIKRHQ